MTGGLAWVFDEDGRFLKDKHYHADFLTCVPYAALDAEAQASIRELIALHAEKTGSTRANWLLADWEGFSEHFVRCTPKPQA
jgi:glutamate synthase (NADPH/NADH) large chain